MQREKGILERKKKRKNKRREQKEKIGYTKHEESNSSHLWDGNKNKSAWCGGSTNGPAFWQQQGW